MSEKGKVIWKLNGWKEAPHCWRQYWKISMKRYCPPEYGDITVVTIFGFVWFVEMYER